MYGTISGLEMDQIPYLKLVNQNAKCKTFAAGQETLGLKIAVKVAMRSGELQIFLKTNVLHQSGCINPLIKDGYGVVHLKTLWNKPDFKNWIL